MVRRGYTFLELGITVAILIILLGLMVSLARYVRHQSANQLTASLLQRLDAAVRLYQTHNEGLLPNVTPLIPENAPVPEESVLHRTARRNNEDVVRALRPYLVRPAMTAKSKVKAKDPAPAAVFGELPTTIYDEITLRDAWGDPIVFMPHDHPAIGMASRAAPSFFFSAGPDHNYLTRDDNLYSYETSPGE